MRRATDWYHTYTRDLSREDFERFFKHDTRDAYDFFARGLDKQALAHLPWWKRVALRSQQIFVAFTLKLPAARRAIYFAALAIAVLGVVRNGTFALVLSLILINLLMLLEVAERLSLKGELEVAREIQLALLPRGTYSTGDLEISGFTKPANTVGGDFYDVLPQSDGRIVLTLGDVAGKGSPAALLMALLLAAFRTLVEEKLEPAALIARLNIQICRHSPASRFITLVYAIYEPATGRLTYVNAGQNPPLILRRNGGFDRMHGTGIALGLFEHAEFTAAETRLEPGDLLVFYSDGITEAEDPSGQPLEESGLEVVLQLHADKAPAEITAEVLAAVQAHAQRARFTDDLTILAVKRSSEPQRTLNP